MKFQVELDEKGTISKAVFKAFGCGSVIASSAYATELLKGMSLEEANKIKNTDISQYLKLPPVKLHCSLLAEEAIHKALEDVKRKQENIKWINQNFKELKCWNKNNIDESKW